MWAETCAQYLFIDETTLERPDFEGGKFVYTPPPREQYHQSTYGARWCLTRWQ